MNSATLLLVATIYWASPSGGANCEQASGDNDPKAYLTVAEAVTCAAAGDVVKLKDGTYAPVTIDGKSGESAKPITLTAENPGRAFIRGNGTRQVLRLANADWWIIENLRIENVDNSGYRGSEAQVVYLYNADDNIVRKNIIRNPNRYGNNGALNVQGDRNLIEDNDVLHFHRNGIELFRPATENNRVRRNYVGQTLDYLGSRTGPNDGFVCYDARHNTWESNIYEGGGAGGGGEGFTCWGAGNRFFGNIALGASGNAMSLAANASVTVEASGYVVRDQVAVGAGIYIRSPIKTDIQGLTAHTSTNRGLLANDLDKVRATSLIIRNMLVINTTGVFTSPIDSLVISHSHEYGPASSWGTGTNGRTNSPPKPPGDVDPRLGVCRTHLPDATPFKNRGYGGGDVGANALFEYVNGIRTQNPLFDNALSGQDRGKLFFGPAVIAGVNDPSTGNVRSTVHQRLGFGTGMCQFPANYGYGRPKAPGTLSVTLSE